MGNVKYKYTLINSMYKSRLQNFKLRTQTGYHQYYYVINNNHGET